MSRFIPTVPLAGTLPALTIATASSRRQARSATGPARPTRWSSFRSSAQGFRHWQVPVLTALMAYSTALGWQAQQVSYPLFRAVAPADFGAYHQQYNDSILFVVIVPGFVGFVWATAFWWTRPGDAPRPLAGLVCFTGLTCIVTTVAWAIPMHARLDALGQSGATMSSLLHANLVRTLALTASTVALTWYAVRRAGTTRRCRDEVSTTSPAPATTAP